MDNNLLGSILKCSVALLMVLVAHIVLLVMRDYLSARLQHRDGFTRTTVLPKLYLQSYKEGVGSFWAIYKQSDSAYFSLLALIWFLPILFLLPVVVLPELNTRFGFGGLLLIAALPMVSLVAQVLAQKRDILISDFRLEREHFFLGVVALITMLVSLCTLVLAYGGGSIVQIAEGSQGGVYWKIFSSPGGFIAGLSVFIAVFLFERNLPFAKGERVELRGPIRFWSNFCDSTWVVSLLFIWVFLFTGGVSGFLGWLLFPLKLVVVVVVYELLRQSAFHFRLANAPGRSILLLVTTALIGFLTELVWIGLIWGK